MSTPKTTHTLHLDIMVKCEHTPVQSEFIKWVNAALNGRKDAAELTIRIVDKTESAALNQRYRQKSGATNVLSFPADYPPEYGISYLGDLVICAPLLAEEAMAQHKTPQAHWAHLTIHGILHLIGYDHVQPEDATRMESLEIQVLHSLGYENPYGDEP